MVQLILTAYNDPRRRPFGETPSLVLKGLIEGGLLEKNIEIIQEPEKAVDYIFSKVEPGDLMVIQVDDLEPVMSDIIERHRQVVTNY
jgi:cyanophycin synthetase